MGSAFLITRGYFYQRLSFQKYYVHTQKMWFFKRFVLNTSAVSMSLKNKCFPLIKCKVVLEVFGNSTYLAGQNYQLKYNHTNSFFSNFILNHQTMQINAISPTLQVSQFIVNTKNSATRPFECKDLSGGVYQISACKNGNSQCGPRIGTCDLSTVSHVYYLI